MSECPHHRSQGWTDERGRSRCSCGDVWVRDAYGPGQHGFRPLGEDDEPLPPFERPTRSEEPSDRLTRLCDAMTKALDAHPERGEEKCVVFLQDGERGGLQLHGYDDDADAIIDVFMHLRAIFRSNGSDLQIHSLGEG
jgi:hypothetical protein